MINILAKNIWSTPQQRYSESSIVKTLESDGIGRPSTYSNIISKLYDKRYIEKKDMLGDVKEYVNYILYPNKKIKEEKEKRNLTDEKSKLVPSDVGIQINNFMLKQFAPIVDSNFTSEIEEDFDKIANGNKKFLNVMNSFYKDFSKLTKSTEVKIKKTDKIKLESYKKEIKLDNKKYIIRIAKYGPVIQFEEFNKKENKDENKYISLVPYLKATGKDIESIKKDDIKLLINLPMKIGKTNNKDIILKYARYGFYLSNGNKNASIFKQYIGLVLDGEFNKIKKLIDNEKIKFK
jgi:DNA topoisomerase-1